MIKKTLVACLLLLYSIIIRAQDPQLSQYYNAPLFLNPAFAGTGGNNTNNNTRGIINYRDQWPGLSTPFVTYAASIDHNIQSRDMGVGLVVRRDQQALGLNSTQVGLLYSYAIYLNDKLTFRPGLQASFVSRSVNYYNYTFGDQINANTGQIATTGADNSLGGKNKLYADFSTGGLLYSDKFWLGVSIYHLNKPNQSFLTPSTSLFVRNTGNYLPMSLILQGGYKISLEETPRRNGKLFKNGKEKSITPTFLYTQQGTYKQLDLGVYVTYDPIMFGLMYRGIPILTYDGIINSEAIIGMVGMHYKEFTFAYSYDFTISKLTNASGGAHEITIIYDFETIHYKKKKGRAIPCPKFYNQ